ncbi:MAG: VUT family protein, partial [Treponema sp.]|nr:VUT family protein [Treponema sp.]
IKVLMKGRMFWTRALASTLVGQLLDSLVFVTVATVLGVFRWESFLSLVLTNYILKCVIETAALPGTSTFVRFLKKREGVDVYDIGVKYNPFR